ncbi:MAG: FHA domain-containing protein [Firmicutes bacterium]|nr:FHA domain-containing protein [Bacillota bacterium]
MRCKECGSTVERGLEFCQQCGAALDDKTDKLETTLSLPRIDIEEGLDNIDVSTEEGPILIVKKGPYIGQKFTLTKDEITLGRDPESDIFLDDITVSRYHAKITVSEDSVSIEDAGSLNGTYVNQIIIDEPTLLKSDDELQIGKFKLVFLSRK